MLSAPFAFSLSLCITVSFRLCGLYTFRLSLWARFVKSSAVLWK